MPRNYQVVLVALVSACLVSATAVSAGDDTYVCTALKEDAGREDPNMGAPLVWWEDGRLRKVEKGQEVYHTGLSPKEMKSDWLDLYAVPRGHGSTFLGSYLKAHFNCRISMD